MRLFLFFISISFFLGCDEPSRDEIFVSKKQNLTTNKKLIKEDKSRIQCFNNESSRKKVEMPPSKKIEMSSKNHIIPGERMEKASWLSAKKTMLLKKRKAARAQSPPDKAYKAYVRAKKRIVLRYMEKTKELQTLHVASPITFQRKMEEWKSKIFKEEIEREISQPSE